MSDLLFTLNAVGPIFLVILAGHLLRRAGWIDEAYIRRSSTIVFRVSLPLLVFEQMMGRDWGGAALGRPVAVFAVVTAAVFALAWLGARFLVPSGPARGALVQGSFRGNIAIIALPVVANTLGADRLALAVILLAAAMPIYNVLAVVVLSVTSGRAGAMHPGRVLREIATNPLILAVAAGYGASLLPWALPVVATRTIGYLAQLTFPLALLGVGASLNRAMLSNRLGPALAAAAVKTVLLPFAACGGAWAIGLRGEALATLFIVTGAPTAVASFIMAKAMHSDGELAAGIVFISTLCALPTLALGIYLLRLAGAV